MREYFWKCFLVLFLSTPLGTISCSDQQQMEDTVESQETEDTEGSYQQGTDQEYGAEDTAENTATEGTNTVGSYEGTAGAGYAEGQTGEGQDELQEIIDGMNQQTTGVGEGMEGELAQQTGEGETLNASQVPVPEGEVQQQQAAVGMAAAPGLPELGSKMSYVVASGDTLGSIAMKIYGDREKWREIAEFTGMANPNWIYPGDVIYYQLTDQSMAFASAYESVVRAEVVVQPGDTLSTISANVLGSSQAWKMIWRQNDNIDNPDSLVVGQTIYYVNSGMLAAATEVNSEGDAIQLAEKMQVNAPLIETTHGGEYINSVADDLNQDFANLESVKIAELI